MTPLNNIRRIAAPALLLALAGPAAASLSLPRPPSVGPAAVIERRLERVVSFASAVEESAAELERLLNSYRRRPGSDAELRLKGALGRFSAGVLSGIDDFREGEGSLPAGLSLFREELTRGREGLNRSIPALEGELRRTEASRSAAGRELERLKSLMDTPLAREYLAERHDRKLEEYRAAGRRIEDFRAGLAARRSARGSLREWEEAGQLLGERVGEFSRWAGRERGQLAGLAEVRESSRRAGEGLGPAREGADLVVRLARGLESLREALDRFGAVGAEIDRVCAETNVIAGGLAAGVAELEGAAGRLGRAAELDREIDLYSRKGVVR